MNTPPSNLEVTQDKLLQRAAEIGRKGCTTCNGHGYVNCIPRDGGDPYPCLCGNCLGAQRPSPNPSIEGGLADELEALVEKAFSPNPREWYVPWRVVPSDGKPTIAGSQSGNLFRGFIGTWQDADLVVALVNNLPAILTALRSIGVVERDGWQLIETFAEPTAPSSGSGVLVADADGTVGEAYYRGFGDTDDGWWWANTNWGDYPEPDRPNPTHWRPLPEPPTLSAAQDTTEGDGG